MLLVNCLPFIVQPVKDNETMQVSTSIPVLEAFKLVYDVRNNDKSPHNFCSDAYKYLMHMYELTVGGVGFMALLLHDYPAAVSESSLRRILGDWYESSVPIRDDLKKRGFIKEYRSERDNSFSVSDEAYEAFRNNKTLGMSFFPDCIQKLADCSLEDVYSPRWLDKFRYSLEKPGNEQLYKACKTLQIFSLEKKLQSAFWALARFFLRHFADPFNLNDRMRTNSRGTIEFNSDAEFEDTLEDLGNLVQFGLADVITHEDDSCTNTDYVLSVHAAGIMFHGHDEVIKYNELAKYATIVKCKDIKKKELFFSNDAQEQIDHLRFMLSQEGFQRALGILKAQNRAPSIVSLLWGPPGTGKTETVLQLALESGRDVIKLDASKVTCRGWGASEKSYRALFRAYGYVAAIAKTIPILLLNEADAVLSKRLMVEHSIDKSENAVTNILLEEMESLTGILLATTNLVDHLDEAFDRRFLFKTELINPDAEARARIWKSCIPQLKDTEASYLANKYEMSGAQIDNVATKRILAELYFCGERGVEYIEGICEKELSSQKGSRSGRSRIGFSSTLNTYPS